MRVLLGYDDAFPEHDTGAGHPERPERLGAVLQGVTDLGLGSDLVMFDPRPATDEELLRVHTPAHLERVAAACATSSRLDADTATSPGSLQAARLAAGAGLEAVDRLRSGEGEVAFLAVRPPGHHARPDGAMGFCLYNNLAVTAARLVEEGERVFVLDWDAHHGNGTQDVFYGDANVLVVSLHQSPLYPGTGRVDERGEGEGWNTTINIPLPPGTGGDAFRLAIEAAVVPAAERFSPTWVLVSCGFDAHRDDPLTDLGLSSGDFGDLTERVMSMGAPGRRMFFLEGGYDLEALRRSTASTLAAMAGERLHPERITNGPLAGSPPVRAEDQPDAVIEAIARRVEEEGFGRQGWFA